MWLCNGRSQRAQKSLDFLYLTCPIPHSKKQFHLDLYRRYIPIMPETVWTFWQNNIILLGPDYWTCWRSLRMFVFGRVWRLIPFFSASWDWNLVRLTQLDSLLWIPFSHWLARVWRNNPWTNKNLDKVKMAWTCLNIFPKLSEDTGRIWLWTKDIYNFRSWCTRTWLYDWSHLLNYWTWQAQ